MLNPQARAAAACRYCVPAGAADAFEEAVQEEAYHDVMAAEQAAQGAGAALGGSMSTRALQALSRRTTMVDPRSPALKQAGEGS